MINVATLHLNQVQLMCTKQFVRSGSVNSIFFPFDVQFYKNLSTGLKDIVWKTGDEVKDEGNNGGKYVLCEFLWYRG